MYHRSEIEEKRGKEKPLAHIESGRSYMKYAIIGAGGCGGSIGAFLAEAGQDVTLIARGAHLAAIREHGIRDGYHSPLRVKPNLPCSKRFTRQIEYSDESGGIVNAAPNSEGRYNKKAAENKHATKIRCENFKRPALQF